MDVEDGHRPPPAFFVGRPRDVDEAALSRAWSKGREP